ncbi:MAG: leucine-rich repeat domain-containing protein [Bacteroides sp.]|nr:leucine-rich repeat domain-containing protein [Bacteroides sp.]
MRKLVCVMIGVLANLTLSARDFLFTCEGQTLPYTVIDKEKGRVEVGKSEESIVGELVIPTEVEYEGTTYTVAAIGENAFRDFREMTSVSLPISIDSIGNFAFYGCAGLTRAEFPSVATLCGIKFGNEYSNPLSYAHNLYIGGNAITELEIPDSVTAIGDDTFNGCRSLTSVNIPESVTTIGQYAFEGCRGLTSLELPESVVSLGKGAFYGCSGLTSITLPSSLSSLESETFYGCRSLTSIDLPETVSSIGNGAFYYCVGLTSITLPDSMTSIGGYAFEGCKSLTTLELPDSLTSIQSDTFKGCSGLTSVKFPEKLVSIGKGAFEGCARLSSILIPDKVRYVGEKSFRNCEALEEVTLPLGLEAIRSGVFAGDKSIKKVVYRGEEPIEGPEDIFDSSVYEEGTLYIHAGTLPLFSSVSPWSLFSNVSDTQTDSDLSGIGDVIGDMTDREVESAIFEVYDLRGVKVADSVKNLAPGLYIVREGNEARKMIVE